jgi:hypothetical protein
MARKGVPYDAQIRTIVALIDGADRENLRVFAGRYYRRYRHELPCIKARVVGPVPYQGSRPLARFNPLPVREPKQPKRKAR